MLAIADADSYLKWSAATLRRLPAGWSRRQVLLRSPTTPSPEQVRAATGEPMAPLSVFALHRLLVRERPDVVLLACTGPTVSALAGWPSLRGADRPVLVTGLPGISVPASGRAVDHRRDCDLLVVHSRREGREFHRLTAARAPHLRVALGRLPFLVSTDADVEAPPAVTEHPDGPVVFAAQAKVPPDRVDREAILLTLAAVRPTGSALVKIRAAAGEQQTHHEEHRYADLWADLVAAGRVDPDAVRFVGGSMATALTGARCLVTVSSTAALEAIDAGVPLVVLDDFGVNAAMINVVFLASGALGSLADVRAGRSFRPSPDWLLDNYFHPAEESGVGVVVAELVRQRREGQLRDSDRGGARLGRNGRGLLRLLAPRRAADVVRWLRPGRHTDDRH